MQHVLSVSTREQPISQVIPLYKPYILSNYCIEFPLSRAISMQTMNFKNRATNFSEKMRWKKIAGEPASAAVHICDLAKLSANATKLELKVSREKSCTFSQKLSNFHSIWNVSMSLLKYAC